MAPQKENQPFGVTQSKPRPQPNRNAVVRPQVSHSQQASEEHGGSKSSEMRNGLEFPLCGSD